MAAFLFHNEGKIFQSISACLASAIMAASILSCEKSARCGNGSAEQGEECDGDDLKGATCFALGFEGGELSCTVECRLDSSGCGTVCGNGVLEQGEECETNEMSGLDCTDFGFSNGTLGCDRYCTFDTSRCTGTGFQCGDGVRQGQEECDGDDLDGHDCIMMGFAGGELSCTDRCLFDTSGCED